MLGQLDGLTCRGLAPIRQLCRDDDHLFVQIAPAAKPLPIQIRPGRIFTEPHHIVTRHDDHHRIAACFMIVLWQLITVMNGPALSFQDLLCHQLCRCIFCLRYAQCILLYALASAQQKAQRRDHHSFHPYPPGSLCLQARNEKGDRNHRSLSPPHACPASFISACLRR